MTSHRTLRPDPDMESRVQSWLDDTTLTPHEADTGLGQLLETFPITPQARRRFLGRWLDRDEGARRRTDDHDHPPEQPRRTRPMFSATGLMAAFGVLALAVSTVNTNPVPPQVGSGHTYVVAADGSGDYSTLSQAIAVAQDGDTIMVRPGTYTESVSVDKDITIEGDGEREAIVLTVESGPIMTVTDADAHVSGLTFTGPTSDGVIVSGGSPTFQDLLFDSVGVPYTGGNHCSRPCDSLQALNGSTITVRDSTFVDGGELGANGGATPVFEGNVLRGGPHIPLFFVGDETIVRGNTIEDTLVRGIGLFGNSSPTIEGNTISNPGQVGIDIEQGSPTVSGNTVTGATNSGVNVIGAGAPIVTANEVTRNATGVFVGGSSTPVVSANEVTDNRIGVSWGGGDGRIEDNMVNGGTAGIVVVTGSPLITGNTIEGTTGRGLALASPSGTVTLTGNTSCSNGTNLFVRDATSVIVDDSNEICVDAVGS